MGWGSYLISGHRKAPKPCTQCHDPCEQVKHFQLTIIVYGAGLLLDAQTVCCNCQQVLLQRSYHIGNLIYTAHGARDPLYSRQHRPVPHNPKRDSVAVTSQLVKIMQCVPPTPTTATHQGRSTMSTASNANDSDAKQSSLSRNALYTPLVAYGQHDVDPSAYMTTRTNVPSALRESSLVAFFSVVSCQASSKPLSTQAIDERIRQRALTLVGGGINSSMTNAQTEKCKKRQRRQDELSNRQRKKIMRDAKAGKKLEQASMKSEKEQCEKFFNTLLELNQKWNIYVRKLLGVDEYESLQTDKDSTFRKTLSSRLVQAELVGAFVKLIECGAHKKWIGKEGLIVGNFQNTWRLAIMQVSSGNVKAKQRPKVLVVPKQGSQLLLQIPIMDGRLFLCAVIHGKHET